MSIPLLSRTNATTAVAGVGLCVALFVTAISLSSNSKPKSNNVRKVGWSFLSAWPFFTRRHDFLQENFAPESEDMFMFEVLHHTITVIRGPQAKKVFYDDKSLSLNEGYKILTGGAPHLRDIDVSSNQIMNSDSQFKKTISTVVLNQDHIQEVLSSLFDLMHVRMGSWVRDGQMDPFKDVYDLVFNMTVRLVTCRELGDDLATVQKLEADLWILEKSATPTAILLPWFPSQAKKDKLNALRNLYTTLYRSVEMRKVAKASPINTFDALLNQGLDTKDIITMTLHMIFAGTVNTGVVSCWLLLFLGMHKDWKAQVLAEVQSLLSTYATDSKRFEPIHKQLATIPVAAWEDKMPITDAVMRETIRLVINAAAFRRNVVEDIQVAGKTIPRGGFAAYPVWDTHLNPEIYDRPLDFDPSRFGPGREEDKQSPLAFLGWGAGRHPCPGTKLAKLELKVLLALFLTAYEYDIVDGSGKLPIALPKPDYNDTQQARPVGEPCFIKFKRVVE